MSYCNTEELKEKLRSMSGKPTDESFMVDIFDVLYIIDYIAEEVRLGKWEKRTWIIFDSEKVGFRCSECNTTWDSPTNFCPNCGAKMKE